MNSSPKPVRALLFDLDDTLFLEEDFVRSGLNAVAAFMAPRLGLAQAPLLDRLWYDFRRLGRTGLFDRLLAAHPLEGVSVKDLVACYRDAAPVIALLPGAEALLARLRQRYALAIVTDGLASTQARKVAALGLESQVDTVVYPWALGKPKPDPAGFLAACEMLKVSPAEAVIVGDDPYHDMAAARAAGMGAIRVRTGRAREVATPELPRPYLEIPGLEALEAALAQLDPDAR